MSEIVSVFSDGGVDGRNPSPHGGSWAWCHVDADNQLVACASGYVEPEDFGLPAVTNNLTELIGLLHGLEALPAGWRGSAFTDSEVTRRRFERPYTAKFHGIPPALVNRVRAATLRAGCVNLVLLGGHPTRAEVKAGQRKDGTLVSEWNVMCDDLCNEAIAARKAGVLPVPVS